MARIRITVDGKLALTVEQAAERLNVAASTMRGELSRYQIEPVATLDGRKKLYAATELLGWWHTRPGRGAPGAPRARRKTA